MSPCRLLASLEGCSPAGPLPETLLPSSSLQWRLYCVVEFTTVILKVPDMLYILIKQTEKSVYHLKPLKTVVTRSHFQVP